MISIFSIYWMNWLLGCALASVLAILGCHLATRDKSMQTLCTSQGAVLGALLGLGILPHLTHSVLGVQIGPLLFALVFASVAFWVSEKLTRTQSASKNTTFTSLFALLLAVSYLMSSLFPMLESHQTQIFFGDLATVSARDSWIGIGASLVVLVLLILSAKPIAKDSFDTAVFGRLAPRNRSRPLFTWLALVVISCSIQFVGLLFTLSQLFIPTAILHRRGGLYRYLLFSSVASLLGAGTGFLCSLYWTRLPTVPAISVCTFIWAIFIRASSKPR